MKLSARVVRRPLILLAALAAVAVPAGACSSSDTLGTGTAVGPVPSDELQRYYAQRLEWGPCESFSPSMMDRETLADRRFECTYMQVPLNYAEPDGETAQIAVLRRKSTRPDQRIGSLVINPGGPGASGVSAAAGISGKIENTPIGERFDLVGFDPRGVGASKPAIQCFTPEERDADRLDTDVDPAVLERKAQDYNAKCEQRSGRELLANAGTRDVARDMDILRSALGDEKLTYLGFSYGTRVGYTYAEAFPQNVRALVLDGALDPDQSLTERTVAQAAGFQQAFDAFAAACAAQAACPLGNDPAAATQRFRDLVIPLIDKPLPLMDGRQLSYNDAVIGTIQALYTQEYWGVLARGLRDLAAGRGDIMMRIADVYHAREPDGSYAFTLDAFTAISCVDDKPVTDPAAVLEADKRAREVAPFRDDGRGPNPARDSCAFWPVPFTSQPHLPNVDNVPPVMVISVTGDPATPYQAGVDLAQALNARLLTVEGNQHTVALQGNSCVDEAVARYLTDLVLPPEGARCAVAAG